MNQSNTDYTKQTKKKQKKNIFLIQIIKHTITYQTLQPQILLPSLDSIIIIMHYSLYFYIDTGMNKGYS